MILSNLKFLTGPRVKFGFLIETRRKFRRRPFLDTLNLAAPYLPDESECTAQCTERVTLKSCSSKPLLCATIFKARL